MEHRYCKTDAGRDEIHHPRRSLPRPVRILLLLLDEKHTGEGWVQLVHGAKMEDLETLLQAGLIVQTCVPASQTAVRQDRPLADAVAQLSYDQLYELLTSQARDRLGLLRGYRFVLEIERCTCIDELQELMVKFLSLVRDHQGAAEARQLSIALCSAGV